MHRNKILVGLLTFLLVALAPVQALAGAPVVSVRNAYASTNVTTSAYVTLIASTAGYINQVVIGDSGGQSFALSFAATCGALATTANSLFVPASTATNPTLISVPFTIPSGFCVGVKALSGNMTTGELDINFLR